MLRLADARSPEVAAAARSVLVIPVGALEQHGPHLPLDTDTAIATAVGEAVVAARSTAGLAPAVPVGSSGEHAGFAGTLSIGNDVLAAVVVELVRDASRDWPAVLLVNGHGGNATALARAARVCADEGRRVGVVHLGVSGMDAHAGRAETSMMLRLAPERVALDQAVAGPTTPVAELLPVLVAEGVLTVSPTGVLGDPVGASAAEGARHLTALVDKALMAYDTLAGR